MGNGIPTSRYIDILVYTDVGPDLCSKQLCVLSESYARNSSFKKETRQLTLLFMCPEPRWYRPNEESR